MRLLWSGAVVLLLFAGCLDTEPSPAGDDGTEPVPTEPTVETWSASGMFYEGASVPGVAGAWVFGVGDRWFPDPVDGDVAAATVTMTWEATSPATERLLVAFGDLHEEDGGQYSERYEYVVGTSPLTLELADVPWTGDSVVWAWFDSQAPAQASIGQPFDIEATFTVA